MLQYLGIELMTFTGMNSKYFIPVSDLCSFGYSGEGYKLRFLLLSFTLKRFPLLIPLIIYWVLPGRIKGDIASGLSRVRHV